MSTEASGPDGSALSEGLGSTGAEAQSDCVLVPRDLLGAACGAIRLNRDAPKVLEELRRYSVGDLSASYNAHLAAHAIEELHRLGYTIRDGDLYPPDAGVPRGAA